jgi:erythronate-4-phosphate dehydrogenase
MVYISVLRNHEKTDRLQGIDGLKIVVDQNIRGAEDTFGHHGDLQFMEGRLISAKDVKDADVLIIRTATRVDRGLLEGSSVRFVGTTSIGTDHLDIDWLDRHGIAWSNAPGCNADSAAQYTLAMIWLACQRLGKPFFEQRVGIVGRGNVGSRLERLLNVLGVETLANDPPLAEKGETGLVSLDDVLDCGIVSLHVPLEPDGPYPTVRMIGALQLSRMPDGALLVNAARGDVIDGEALLQELKTGRLHAALDVWPGEPVFSADLLKRVVVATPHVGGYSLDGKRNGTGIVYRAFCKWAGIEPRHLSAGSAPAAGERLMELRLEPGDDPITSALEATCFVPRHDEAMGRLVSLTVEQRAAEFDRLRKEYPPRRDFHGWTVRDADPAAAALLGRLGFSIG